MDLASEGQRARIEGSYDVFFTNQIYPDAKSIFGVPHHLLDDIKDDCYVVLDTNTLLLPYTVSKESLQQIERTYATLAERNNLVIPAQVAREFARNRPMKIMELYQQLFRRITSQHATGSYPLLESFAEYQEAQEIERQLLALQRKYNSAVRKVLDYIAGWYWNDPVSAVYDRLFKSTIVFDPPVDEERTRDDLARRKFYKLPPGYKDASKHDEGVGDLLIWQTILHLARENSKSVIFVSSDEKADWRYQSESKVLYPRYELIYEFARASDNQSFHIINLSQLLEIYGASNETVIEVRHEEARQEAQQMIDASSTSPNMYQSNLRTDEISQAVLSWLRENYPSFVFVENDGKPSLIAVDQHGNRIGVEIAINLQPYRVADNIRLYTEVYLDRFRLSQLLYLIVASDPRAARAFLAFSSIYNDENPRLRFVLGYVTIDNQFQVVHVYPQK